MDKNVVIVIVLIVLLSVDVRLFILGVIGALVYPKFINYQSSKTTPGAV